MINVKRNCKFRSSIPFSVLQKKRPGYLPISGACVAKSSSLPVKCVFVENQVFLSLPGRTLLKLAHPHFDLLTFLCICLGKFWLELVPLPPSKPQNFKFLPGAQLHKKKKILLSAAAAAFGIAELDLRSTCLVFNTWIYFWPVVISLELSKYQKVSWFKPQL